MGRAAAGVRADPHRRRCRTRRDMGPRDPGGAWAGPGPPAGPVTSHQPASRRRARASAPATAAAASTMPSTTMVAAEAPSPPSDATLTRTISSHRPERAGEARGRGVGRAALGRLPCADGARRGRRDGPQRGEEDGGQRAALGPSLPGVADDRGDEDHRDEDGGDHRAGAGADAAQRASGGRRPRRAAGGCRGRPSLADPQRAHDVVDARAGDLALGHAHAEVHERLVGAQREHGDDPRRLDPAAGRAPSTRRAARRPRRGRRSACSRRAWRRDAGPGSRPRPGAPRR